MTRNPKQSSVSEPTSEEPREIENPGDPGPPVLVPPSGDRRDNDKLPPHPEPPPAI